MQVPVYNTKCTRERYILRKENKNCLVRWIARFAHWQGIAIAFGKTETCKSCQWATNDLTSRTGTRCIFDDNDYYSTLWPIGDKQVPLEYKVFLISNFHGKHIRIPTRLYIAIYAHFIPLYRVQNYFVCSNNILVIVWLNKFMLIEFALWS